MWLSVILVQRMVSGQARESKLRCTISCSCTIKALQLFQAVVSVKRPETKEKRKSKKNFYYFRDFKKLP